MNIENIEKELIKLLPKMEESIDMEGNKIRSIYLGSYMSLDPCGKYHHFISPNGVTEECEKYWDNLEKVANKLGGYITSGEGDPTDIYFEMPSNEESEEE